MPDAAQSTLGLFDTTALGWTVEAPRAEQNRPNATPAERGEESSEYPPAPPVQGKNCYLDSDRSLARGWISPARDNIAAIRLSKELEACPGPRSGERGRAPTAEEQAQLLRFVGFGATELAQNCFPLPGAAGFRPGRQEIRRELADSVSPAEYAALQRATQYAHYTPEPIIPTLWRPAQPLAFTPRPVLDPRMPPPPFL